MLRLVHAGPAGTYVAMDLVEVRTAVGPGLHDLSDSAVPRTGSWMTYAVAGPSLGNLQIGLTPGSATTLYFTGRGFTLAYLRHTDLGNIEVYLDGSPTPMETIPTSGSTTLLSYTSPLLASGNHEVRLVHGGPAGKYIGLDAITITP